MAIRRICVDEVTSSVVTFSETITCTEPSFTPVTGAGDECHAILDNVQLDFSTSPPTLSFSFGAQFEYAYRLDSSTFYDYCNVFNQSGSTNITSGTTNCCGTPQIEYAINCDPANITTTETTVTGVVDFAFTVSNLCISTIICVDDTTCP